MASKGVEKLGTTIGSLSKQQTVLEQNISPDDSLGLTDITFFDRVEVSGSVSLKELTLPTDSFVIDHPVYGDVDSSTLKIDGGYLFWNDLYAAYSFSGNANDDSPLGNDVTFVAATLTTDRNGNANSAYSFDGVDDYLVTPDGPGNEVKTFSFNSQTTQPASIRFNDDGTKLYILGRELDTVFEYDLSTAYDVTTCAYNGVGFLITEDTQPLGIAFSSDGTKMYATGNVTDRIYQYTLSTPWDLSTCSYASKSFLVSGQDTIPIGIWFKPDGTRYYITGDTGNKIVEYSVGTAWDITTSSYVSQYVQLDSVPQDLCIDSSGQKLYLIGSGSDVIRYFYMSTPWDLTTISADDYLLFTGHEDVYESAPDGIVMSPDLLTLYYVGQTRDKVYQVPMNTATYTTTWKDAIRNPRWSYGGTLACWVKVEGLGGANAGRIIDKTVGSSIDYGFSLYVLSGGYFNFRIHTGTANQSAANSFTIGGDWVHVGATWDSDGYTQLYVNGAPSGTRQLSQPADRISVNFITIIGGRSRVTDRAFNGKIDEVVMITRECSADEMARLYSNSVYPFHKHLTTINL